MRNSFFAFALLLAAASSAVAAGQQTQSQIAPSGIAQISGGLGPAGPGDEFRKRDEIDKRTPGTGTGLARVPASHVPTPPANVKWAIKPATSSIVI